MRHPILFSAVMLLLLSCNSSGENQSESEAPETGAPEMTAPSAGVQPPYELADSSEIFTVDGVQIYIVEKGGGPKPQPGSNVVINYHGTLLDGSVFDSSFDKPGYQDFSLNQLIQGWQVGLTQVPTGSKVKLIVPPELGYGAQDRPGIPGNSTLVFDIELVSAY
jgi:FKBP-type peptidyl-prolyl cis-trans isomerase FkpA